MKTLELLDKEIKVIEAIREVIEGTGKGSVNVQVTDSAICSIMVAMEKL